MHQLNQSRDPARAQGQWLQGLEHRFPVGVRPEGPGREQVHVTNMFVYVPVVSTGWDGGNQAVSDWLGARNLTTEDLGAEPYVAVLLGGSGSHLKFMGGFDTSVESPADMNEAADQGKWLMEYADRPDLGLESCHGAPGSRRCLADTFREETEREPRVVLLRMRDQEVGGRVVRSMIRLCIWVGRFPHTTTANHDWLEDDIDVVALDQLLSVQSVGAWRSFTLWQAFAGAVRSRLGIGGTYYQRPPRHRLVWPTVVAASSAWDWSVDAATGRSHLLGCTEDILRQVLQQAGHRACMLVGQTCRDLHRLVGTCMTASFWRLRGAIGELPGWSLRAILHDTEVPVHSCLQWRLESAEEGLLWGLDDAGIRRDWILLHLFRVTWEIACTSDRSVVDGRHTSDDLRLFHVQEAEQGHDGNGCGTARLAEIRPGLICALDEFYGDLTRGLCSLSQCQRRTFRPPEFGETASREVNKLATAIEWLVTYGAFPQASAQIRAAERWLRTANGPDRLTMPLIPRLAAVQAVICWLWSDLETVEGAILLCRVFRQYVLRDVDWRPYDKRLPMTMDDAYTASAFVSRRGPLANADVADMYLVSGCVRCNWPTVEVGTQECRCAEGAVEPPRLWRVGPLMRHLPKLQRALACPYLAGDQTVHGNVPCGLDRWRCLSGVWTSGLMTIRIISTPQHIADINGVLEVAVLPAAATPERAASIPMTRRSRAGARLVGRSLCVGCGSTAESICHYQPDRCDAQACSRRCGVIRACTCMGYYGPVPVDGGGWPVNVSAQVGTWGPGSEAARLGGHLHLVAAVRGGCCGLPDGWGSDQLPGVMQRIADGWEREASDLAALDLGSASSSTLGGWDGLGGWWGRGSGCADDADLAGDHDSASGTSLSSTHHFVLPEEVAALGDETQVGEPAEGGREADMARGRRRRKRRPRQQVGGESSSRQGGAGTTSTTSSRSMPSSSGRFRPRCECCGGKGHAREGCRFIFHRCYKCGQIGHLVRVCEGRSRCGRCGQLGHTAHMCSSES